MCRHVHEKMPRIITPLESAGSSAAFEMHTSSLRLQETNRTQSLDFLEKPLRRQDQGLTFQSYACSA